MRAPISIVIPTLNSEDSLGGCLASLVEGLEMGLIREVIISDGGSDDATGALARAWGAEVVQGATSRGGQLLRGCEMAQGDWFLVLHADTQLAPGWARPVRSHLKGAGVGWFSLRFDHTGLPARMVAGWANLRSRMFGLPYGDQGLLISRETYEISGGYPDQPLMEDVALVRKLHGQLIRLDAVAVTSAEKYRTQGWLRRGARNLWTLTRYFMGTPPETLAKNYRRP